MESYIANIHLKLLICLLFSSAVLILEDNMDVKLTGITCNFLKIFTLTSPPYKDFVKLNKAFAFLDASNKSLLFCAVGRSNFSRLTIAFSPVN